MIRRPRSIFILSYSAPPNSHSRIEIHRHVLFKTSSKNRKHYSIFHQGQSSGPHHKSTIHQNHWQDHSATTSTDYTKTPLFSSGKHFQATIIKYSEIFTVLGMKNTTMNPTWYGIKSGTCMKRFRNENVPSITVRIKNRRWACWVEKRGFCSLAEKKNFPFSMFLSLLS